MFGLKNTFSLTTSLCHNQPQPAVTVRLSRPEERIAGLRTGPGRVTNSGVDGIVGQLRPN